MMRARDASSIDDALGISTRILSGFVPSDAAIDDALERVRADARRRRGESPRMHARAGALGELLGGGAMARVPLAPPEALARLTRDAVRSYIDACWGPSVATLAVVIDADAGAILESARASLGDLERRGADGSAIRGPLIGEASGRVVVAGSTRLERGLVGMVWFDPGDDGARGPEELARVALAGEVMRARVNRVVRGSVGGVRSAGVVAAELFGRRVFAQMVARVRAGPVARGGRRVGARAHAARPRRRDARGGGSGARHHRAAVVRQARALDARRPARTRPRPRAHDRERAVGRRPRRVARGRPRADRRARRRDGQRDDRDARRRARAGDDRHARGGSARSRRGPERGCARAGGRSGPARGSVARADRGARARPGARGRRRRGGARARGVGDRLGRLANGVWVRHREMSGPGVHLAVHVPIDPESAQPAGAGALVREAMERGRLVARLDDEVDRYAADHGIETRVTRSGHGLTLVVRAPARSLDAMVEYAYALITDLRIDEGAAHAVSARGGAQPPIGPMERAVERVLRGAHAAGWDRRGARRRRGVAVVVARARRGADRGGDLRPSGRGAGAGRVRPRARRARGRSAADDGPARRRRTRTRWGASA